MRHPSYVWKCLTVGLLTGGFAYGWAGFAPSAWGQDDAPAKDAAPEAKAGDDKPAAPEAGNAIADYQQKLNEWKEILKQLRDTRAKYDVAKKEELEAIRSQWKSLVAQGEALIPGLRAASKAAYLAAPNEDRQLTRFLAKIMEDALSRDQYEATLDVALALVENNSGIKEAVEAAGIAAFVLNDYPTAEKYLKQAQAEGSLTGNGAKYFGELENYKALWAKESEIRAKEAEADDLPRVRIVTNKGEMVAELFENEAPETVGNFINLVEKGFYDGLKFHRVLAGFMAQGGCPKGDGTGGPGYRIYCETKNPEHRNHFRGTLSMAHAGPNTGGSQFFLTFVPTSHLNGRHTAFGRIVEGLDVLDKIQRVDPQGEGEKPELDRIEKVEVLRKRDHEYVPHKVQ